MTPKLLNWEDGEIMELSIVSGKLSIFSKLDLVPKRRTLVLSELSLRKLHENRDLISTKQSKREKERREELG